jgi:hypothetical protein
MQVVAFAYRPIQNPSAINITNALVSSTPYVYEIFDKHHLYDKQKRPITQSSRPSTKSRINCRFDSNLKDHLDQSDYLRNITKNMVFLSIASFTYDPKPVFENNQERYRFY